MQCNAISCQAQLSETIAAQTANGVHQREDISSYGGFTTCKPYFRDTLRDKEGGEVRDLWGCEKAGGWRERHALFGHAICAAEVTALRDTDAKIVMLAGKFICEKIGEGFGSL